MDFACGIDLHGRTSQVCVIDKDHSIQLNENVPNELEMLLALLAPYGPGLRIVIESTFNWYWLVDGLQEGGYNVTLAHALGLSFISKQKHKNDPMDAFRLAKLLMAGMIPEAYIYPKETRPVRDLLRRRLDVVRLRAREYTCIRMLLLREGLMEHSRSEMMESEDKELDEWFDHPLVRLHTQQELERIELYTAQVTELEQVIKERTKDSRDYLALQEVPGLGELLSLTVLYEIGDIRRFKSAKHLSSYCRVIPGSADSAGKSRRGRGSKQGNAYLKWAFSYAALIAVTRYPRIKKYFERQVKRRKGKGQKPISYNCVSHKLVTAVYYILRDGVRYDDDLLFGNSVPKKASPRSACSSGRLERQLKKGQLSRLDARYTSRKLNA